MKKSSTLFIALICFSLYAKAQTTTYRQVYLGVGGFPHSKGVSGDLTLELRGRVTSTSNFLFGVRFQVAATPNTGYTSICFVGDYYFTRPENGLRVFAGAGLGGFNDIKRPNDNTEHFFDPNYSNFGFFPRIGVDFWRFRLSGEYNVTGGTDNYAAVNLGFFF
ncbi:MAG TPA: hypothetical protein VFE53_06245 [Mucilaginibacter sp.]|nr:hypothetical protein [Mucilaginibacter sp.]